MLSGFAWVLFNRFLICVSYFVCVCVCEREHARAVSCAWLFVTPWTVPRQAPLSMGFSRQEHWRGLPFPPPGDLPNPGIEPSSPALAGGFFTTEPHGKPVPYFKRHHLINFSGTFLRAEVVFVPPPLHKGSCLTLKLPEITWSLLCWSSWSNLPTSV